MPSIFKIDHDIVGEDYAVLIRSALSRFDAFTLTWPHALTYADNLHDFAYEMRCLQLDKDQDMILYRLDADASRVLLRPGSLFRWRFPQYPEDVTFYRSGQTGFVSSSHQEAGWILDAEFARSLPPRLGFAEEIVSERLLQKVL